MVISVTGLVIVMKYLSRCGLAGVAACHPTVANGSTEAAMAEVRCCTEARKLRNRHVGVRRGVPAQPVVGAHRWPEAERGGGLALVDVVTRRGGVVGGAPLQPKRLVIESQWASNLWPSLASCDHRDPIPSLTWLLELLRAFL